MKSDIKPFYEDVMSWLKQASLFQSIVTENYASWPALVKIKPEKGKPLEIALIALDDWATNPDLYIVLSEYHIKQQQLRSEGINSIILWEDFWKTRTDIVKSRIASLLGISKTIPARLTQVRRIDKKLSREFLDRNHMQGNPSSKYRYGLFLPSRYYRVLPEGLSEITSESPELLVVVATFSAPRIFSRDGEPHRSYELIRFASLLDTTVVGGFDKLIKHFIKEIQPDDIMTYADLEWSDGRSYQKLGFEYISDKEPMKILLDTTNFTRTSVISFAAEGNNLIKVLNAGSRKFVKTVEKA